MGPSRLQRRWTTDVAFLAWLLAGLWAVPAGAQTLEIRTNFRFTGNVSCNTSPCISIVAPNVRVDGRGFTVQCAGGQNQDGLVIVASGVTLSNLAFVNCGNSVIVRNTASGTTLRGVASRNHTRTGFDISGGRSQVLRCRAVRPVQNSDNTVGFLVRATAVLRDNVATGHEQGIFLTSGASGSQVTRNRCTQNGDGIYVNDGALDNELTRNVALDNTNDDLLDENVAQGQCGNVWRRNRFQTDNELGPNEGPGAGCIQ